MSDKHCSYRVVIPYREPTYEKYRGRRRNKPYRAPYVVAAYSAKEAIRKALKLFRQDERNSHVGWQRVPEYDDIEVEHL